MIGTIMAKVNYLLNRNGIYYFRMPFPLNIIDFVGKREFKLSLRTSNKQEALSICTSLTCKARELCHTLNLMKQADYLISKELALKFFEERIKHTYEIMYDLCPISGVGEDHIQDVKAQFLKQQLYHDYSSIEEMTNDFIKKEKLNIAPNQMPELLNLFHKAEYEAFLKSHAIFIGDTDYKPSYPPFNEHRLEPQTTYSAIQTIDASPVDEETLHDLIDKYLLHREKQVKIGAIEIGTLNDDKLSLDNMKELVPNNNISSIQKPQMRVLRDQLSKLPKNHSKSPKYKEKSITELMECSIPIEDECSTQTKNKRLANISGFFKWLIDEGYYSHTNPMNGLKHVDNVKASDKRKPFTDAEVISIFESSLYTGSENYKRKRFVKGSLPPLKDDLYWFLLVALYTGARLNEIYQLTIKDIDEIDGIQCFSFNDENEKTVKTDNAIRNVPIHQKLIDLGFLEFAKSTNKDQYQKVFKNLSSADALSKKFSRILETLNIKSKKNSFHSLRHTFIDKLRAYETPDAISMRIVGHSSSNNVHANYGGTNIKTLNNYIQKINYNIDIK